LEEIFRSRIDEANPILGIDNENSVGQSVEDGCRTRKHGGVAISSKR
jgi:hypothetical protein